MKIIKLITIILMIISSIIGCSNNITTENNKTIIKGFQLELNNSQKYDEEPLLYGYNCKIDYNPTFCKKNQKYYQDNYDIIFDVKE